MSKRPTLSIAICKNCGPLFGKEGDKCEYCGEVMKEENPAQETKYRKCDLCNSLTIEYMIMVRKIYPDKDVTSLVAKLYCCSECAKKSMK